MSSLIRRSNRSALGDPRQSDTLTFNFAAVLPGRAASPHTQRAYFRWVDTYLVDVAGWQPTKGDARIERMQALPIPVLVSSISASHLRAWLGSLGARGHGKQGLDQARAAIVTLADLLAEAEWLEDYVAASLARVRAPRAEDGQRPGRWLSLAQVRALMAAGEQIATSPTQALRNRVILLTLCTMALRRDEIARARWGDLSVQNDRAVMKVHGKGRKVAMIDVPRPVVRALSDWRALLPQDAPPAPRSPLLRRIWKGGRIGKEGLTADGIWFLVEAAAEQAGIGHVAPHDLRRSVAGALHESGVPVDKISRLLRHSNIAVTERYLNRLPQRNEGALLMSDMLFDDDADESWHGIE